MVRLAVSLYAAVLLFTWLDYFMKLTGYVTLESALLYTLITPLVTFVGFRIYLTRSLRFWKLLWIIFGAAVFGFIIYAFAFFLLNRVLSLTAWEEMDGLTHTVLIMPVSYVIGAYLGYRLGKRREFMPIFFQL
jgi:hypothetical protein